METTFDFRMKQQAYKAALDIYEELGALLEEEVTRQTEAGQTIGSETTGETTLVFQKGIRDFHTNGIYGEACNKTKELCRIMKDALVEINALLARCEGFADQLKNNAYVEPVRPVAGDDRVWNGGILALDYDKITGIKNLCDDITDDNLHIKWQLESIIADYGHLVPEIKSYTSYVDSASGKLNRIQNFKDSFQEYESGIRALEYDLMLQLSGMTEFSVLQSILPERLRANPILKIERLGYNMRQHLVDENVSSVLLKSSIRNDIRDCIENAPYAELSRKETALLHYLFENDERFVNWDVIDINNMIDYLITEKALLLNNLFVTSRYSSSDFNIIKEMILTLCHELFEIDSNEEGTTDVEDKENKENTNNTENNTNDILTFPIHGDEITVSLGIDLGENELVKATVSKWNTWSREYSVDGCNLKYSGEPCCRRLNYAIENYECNSTDDDLLMFELEGYDEVVYAGAMVEGYADIGDIVEVTLDDGNTFFFMILDVKSTQHTAAELSINKQCQWELGHGYMLDEDTVQLSICEFITAGSCSVQNVQDTKSGGFLYHRSVVQTQIIDHVEICD